MTAFKPFLIATLAAVLLVGCSDNGNGSGGVADGGGAEPQTVAFSALVSDMFANSEWGEPVAINERSITFDNQDSGEAFNDLLSSP